MRSFEGLGAKNIVGAALAAGVGSVVLSGCNHHFGCDPKGIAAHCGVKQDKETSKSSAPKVGKPASGKVSLKKSIARHGGGYEELFGHGDEIDAVIPDKYGCHQPSVFLTKSGTFPGTKDPGWHAESKNGRDLGDNTTAAAAAKKLGCKAVSLGSPVEGYPELTAGHASEPSPLFSDEAVAFGALDLVTSDPTSFKLPTAVE